MPGLDVLVNEPVPLLLKFRSQIVLKVFVVGHSQVQIQLRDYDVEGVADTDDGFVDVDRAWGPELDGEMGFHEPCAFLFVMSLTFETQSSKRKVHDDLVAVGSTSWDSSDGFKVLAEEGGTRTEEWGVEHFRDLTQFIQEPWTMCIDVGLEGLDLVGVDCWRLSKEDIDDGLVVECRSGRSLENIDVVQEVAFEGVVRDIRPFAEAFNECEGELSEVLAKKHLLALDQVDQVRVQVGFDVHELVR